jgi:pyruvate dehydrogenase E2 component (dihydrolipoamide acetyltransferase)
MQLRLPDLGEGVTEGEVARFLVKTGDSVKEDQVVLEVMTDKATVEIPTRVAGVIGELFVKEGDMVKVGGQLLDVMEAGGVKSQASKPAAKAPAVVNTTVQSIAAHSSPAATPMLAANGGNVAAAPAVRKLARERGINLSQVFGSGPNGRVLLSDLAVGAQTKAPTGNYSYAVDARPKSVPGSREVERIPLRGLRKKIVEKMAISKRTAAHFTCVEECDVTELVAFRNSIKDEAKARGVNMTFMPFIAKACLFALRKFPELNSQLVEDGAGGGEILRKHYYNFGIAVDTEDGLTVPVVHDVDQKSLMDLARDIGDAGSRARDRKLAAADFADGTFTITNAGKVGGLFATPVINYPEVAIMGVHEIRKRPWVVDGEIKIRDIMYVSISLDHRIVDGAKGILFLNEVNSYLSNPKKFLLEMV